MVATGVELKELGERCGMQAWVDGVKPGVGMDPSVTSLVDDSVVGGSVFDDDFASVVHSDVEDVVVESFVPVSSRRQAEAVVKSCLRARAVAEQRFRVIGLRRAYARGRMHLDPLSVEPEVVRQKVFSVPSFMTVTSVTDEDLFSRLRAGRVITRLGAVTGLGKTTKLPAMIAKCCELRVCQLELDAVVAAQASAKQRADFSVPGRDRSWSRKRSAYLSVMSYRDFVGLVLSAGRERLFADFDVFYFDEAHVPTADVYLAKHFFSAFAKPHNSLIIASATVSTDVAEHRTNAAVGAFSQANYTFREGVSNGRLFALIPRDRTLVLLPSDIEVWNARQVYYDMGVEVRILDTASILADVNDTFNFLQGASSTPRVVVAHESFGTGYNLPVSFVISSGSRMIYELDSSHRLHEVEQFVSEDELAQHKGRTGRGIVTGSGGLILKGASLECPTGLLPSERLEAYIGLVAAGIHPRSGNYGEEVARILPNGLSHAVALGIMRIALPPAVVLRYLGRDGLVARRFAVAMNLFAQPDFFVRPSEDLDPIGYDQWIPEIVGSYFEGDDSTSTLSVRVPFQSPPSLKVAMHTLYATACGWLMIERWRPVGMDEGDRSDDEETSRPVRNRRRVVPRVIVDEDAPPPVPEKEPPWAYNTLLSGQAKAKRRLARSWADDPVGRESVKRLVDSAEGRAVLGSPVVDVTFVEDDGIKVAKIESKDKERVEVNSPGGSVIMTFRVEVYEKLMSGDVMDSSLFVSLLKAVKKNESRFAKSSLFDNWAPPWESVFKAFADDACVIAMKNAALHTVGIGVLSKLYDRYRQEALHVCKTSNLYRETFLKVFPRVMSVTRVAAAVRSGKLPIAQSDRFVARLLYLKELHDRSTLYLEKHSLYVPTQVTAAQRRLPINRKPLLGVIDSKTSSNNFKIV